MRTVFADTFYFLAIINPKEPAHEAAVQYSTSHRLRLLTTHWVILEVGNALSRGPNRRVFRQLFQNLMGAPGNEVAAATDELFSRGVELFDARADKTWSLTDCLSFIVVEDRRITDALTADRHFEQAGFRALLA